MVEQVQPASGLVATISLPDNFSGQMTKLLVTLANSVPVTGMPVAILATIDNMDKDGDGVGDLDQILSPSRDLVLALPDVGVTGDYHVVVALYMQGGGQFQPVPGTDYMANSQKIRLGQGKVSLALDLELVPAFGAAPELLVELNPNNTLLISWPATATGFQLQEASDAGSRTWSDVRLPAKVVGNRYQVTIDGPAGGRFYRLHRP